MESAVQPFAKGYGEFIDVAFQMPLKFLECLWCEVMLVPIKGVIKGVRLEQYHINIIETKVNAAWFDSAFPISTGASELSHSLCCPDANVRRWP